MHPTYKTSFPFMYIALSDLVVELGDYGDDDDEYEDYIFLESLSLRKRATFMVIGFYN